MYEGKILIFGAGATGRGHLGQLLYQDGQRTIVFVDKKPELVKAINESKGYDVRLLTGNNKPESLCHVSNVTAICRTDEDMIVESFCQSNLVLTAVIAENLPDIADIIAKCIQARYQNCNTEYMNIICCENLDNASSYLKSMVYQQLSDEVRSYCDAYVGFPDAMISRVVPVPPADTLSIVTEDYNEWTVDSYGFKGEHLRIPSIDIVDNLPARLERKLWIHNGGHATLAYAAIHMKYKYVHEALENPELAAFTAAVLDEIGNCILDKYHNAFTEEEIRHYEADLGRRGLIAEIKDDISRVVRDPLRKLGIKDRLLAPAIYASNHGIPHSNLIRSIVNATNYYSSSDAESVKMRESIDKDGYDAFILETLGLNKYPDLANEIISCKKCWEENQKCNL